MDDMGALTVYRRLFPSSLHIELLKWNISAVTKFKNFAFGKEMTVVHVRPSLFLDVTLLNVPEQRRLQPRC
jgi:hypothetical protein